MTTLAEHATNDLSIRRALGFNSAPRSGCSTSSSRAPRRPDR